MFRGIVTDLFTEKRAIFSCSGLAHMARSSLRSQFDMDVPNLRQLSLVCQTNDRNGLVSDNVASLLRGDFRCRAHTQIAAECHHSAKLWIVPHSCYFCCHFNRILCRKGAELWKRRANELRAHAVRIALTIGLLRKQEAHDLGVSTSEQMDCGTSSH